MHIGTKYIPNLSIENIGSKKKPLHVIKGFIELPCWNGYFLYDDSYKLVKSKVITNGRITLWVDGLITADNNMEFTPEQVHAYSYLIQQQESIKSAILQGLKAEFPNLLDDEYGSWDTDAPDFPKLSELTESFDFKDFIGPDTVTIGEDVKEESAYLSWHFRSRWDVEHGFEVITHKDRLVSISLDPDPWKIYMDNGTYEQELQAYNERMKVPKAAKRKKWWQFW